MSAFVISLVVVCAAVVITLKVVLRNEAGLDKPATPQAERDRETAIQAAVPFPATWGMRALAPTPLQRFRSAVLLIVIVTLLGALAALLIGVGGAILVSGLRDAVQ
ncbi:MAG TPA: hypothetical protein VFV00_12910 [Acidimicrobiales bacterium]|nr:hypothetical protein [Acidimicrobiales bacterium]